MKFWCRRGPTQNPPCIVSARGMTSPAAADCREKSVGQVVTWGCNGLRQACWRWISRRCRCSEMGSPEFCGRSKFRWPIDLCELPRCSLSITSGRGSCGQLGRAPKPGVISILIMMVLVGVHESPCGAALAAEGMVLIGRGRRTLDSTAAAAAPWLAIWLRTRRSLRRSFDFDPNRSRGNRQMEPVGSLRFPSTPVCSDAKNEG